MKRLTAIGLLLLGGAAGRIVAETFTIAPAAVAAGATVDVELHLACEADKWGGFQFDMRLPEGVTIVEDEEGFYCVEAERLTYTYRGRQECFGIDVGRLDDGSYRFLVDNNRGKTISGTEGALMTIRLVCAPTVATGDYAIALSNQKLANTDGSQSDKPADNTAAGTLAVSMDVRIGATGYASFSWPLALDFTDTGAEAYIATSLANGNLHLERVTKVPPATGLVLKGDPGTYHPTTSDVAGVTDDVAANMLLATAEAPAASTADNSIFALADNEGRVGFYHVREGLAVPRYKAYLDLTGDAAVRSYIGFDGIATGLYPALFSRGNTAARWFHIDGTTLDKPRQGVNINQGQKILIKQQ